MFNQNRHGANTISVIVRYHDFKKLNYLDECLFSLACQSYDDLEVVVVTQNFSDSDFAETARLSDVYSWQIKTLKFTNVVSPPDVDARSRLINEGFRHSIGRYVAFLDFDDTVYSNAYKVLKDRIELTKAAVCIGGVNRVDFFNAGGARHKNRRSKLFGTAPKLAFFIENQYPIHSYILDTWSIDEEFLRFNEDMSRNEDYLFLIKILARYPSDDWLTNTQICDYYINVDGGNTILAYGATELDFAKWKIAENQVEDARDKLSITVHYKELKKFAEWAGNDKSAALRDRLSQSEQILGSVIANHQSFSSRLHKLITREASPTDSTLYYIDGCDLNENGSFRVRGWCAGSEAAVPLAFAVERNDGEAVDAEVKRLARPDVAEHFSASDSHFGFETEVQYTGPYTLRFLADDGLIYKIQFLVS